MKIFRLFIITFTTIILLAGCSAKEAPLDSNGETPQQVLMRTYVQIIEGKYDEAQMNFSAAFIEEFITKKNITFVDYATEYTKGWKVEWLRTKLVGNDYNDNMWRADIIPDEGKGPHNRPGAVQDFYIIDGVWKIVFWNHYPKL